MEICFLPFSLPEHFLRFLFPTLHPISLLPQEAFQIGIYWAHTNTVHKSTALKLVHDLTSPRWKDGSGTEVVTLDEEGYVEADITLGAFPGRQKVRVASVQRLSCVTQREMHGVFWSSTRKPLVQAFTFIPHGRSKLTATLTAPVHSGDPCPQKDIQRCQAIIISVDFTLSQSIDR